MLITQIYSGKAFGEHRKATLIANETLAQAGKLASLTDFLRSKGLTATPGYDEGHLLRVQGFSSDDQLRDLLTVGYPAWCKEHDIHLGEEPLLVKDTVFIPLDTNDRQPYDRKRMMRQYATPLVGATSMLGGGTMLVSDILTFADNKARPIEKMKAGISGSAALFFVAASGLLTGFGWLAARKPSVTQLLHNFDNQIDQDPAHFKPVKPTAFQHTKDYALNNPWKFATVLNVFGAIIKAVGHSIPHHKVGINSFTLKQSTKYGPDKMELLSTGLALVSLGLISTAKTEEPTTLLNITSFEDSAHARDPLEQRYRNTILAPMSPGNDQGKTGHMNMKAAGYLGMMSNIGFGAKGALDASVGLRMKGDLARKMGKRWPMTLLVPFNVAADYFTTLAKPNVTYSLDELATDAAAIIAHKLDVKTADPETVVRQTYMLSELVASHPRVTNSAHQLREAIAGRLAIDYGYKIPSVGAGLNEYKHLMEISPFSTVAGRVAAATPAATAQADAAAPVTKAPVSFVNRVQRQEPAAHAVLTH